MYDIVIIGRGPAGISSALYGSRANLSVAVLAKDNGSLAKAGSIDNYYGFDTPISGNALVLKGVAQAKRVGAQIFDEEVLDIEWNDGAFDVKTKDQVYRGRSVILATGARRNKAHVKGLEALEGHGISYCAVCDGFFYKGKDVAVLGNGEYALEETNALLPIVNSVTLFTQGEPLKAAFPEAVKIVSDPIAEVHGDGKVEGMRLTDGTDVPVTGVFVALGSASAVDLARKLGAGVVGSSISVDDRMATNIPGLFAAGDCIGGTLQVAVAVGEGAKAALNAITFVRSQRNDKGNA